MKMHEAGGAGIAEAAFHPLSLHFPRLSDAQLKDWADEIRERGDAAPFLTRDGVYVDDHNRYLACKMARVKIVSAECDGFDPVAVVITRSNLPRAFLTESQRAAIAVPIAAELSREGLGRRAGNLKGQDSREGLGRRAGNLKGQDPNADPNAEKPKTAFSAKFTETAQCAVSGNTKLNPNSEKLGTAAKQAADLFHISESAVNQATRLWKENRQLYDMLLAGQMNLSRARVAVSKIAREKTLPASTRQSAIGNRKSDDELIVGDCCSRMAAMPDGSMNLVFADPPYNLGWRYDSDPTSDLLPEARYLDWTERWMRHCMRLLTPTGSLFVLIDSRWQGRFDVTLRNIGLSWRNTIVWRDPFPTHTDARFQPSARFLHYFTRSPKHFCWNADAIRVPSVRDQIGDARRVHDKGIVPHDVWDCPRIVGNAKDRVPFEDAPPQVPALIVERCILAASKEGDRVFDPFTGNGTTWRAARKLGRKFSGIERSAKYAEQAKQWALSEQ